MRRIGFLLPVMAACAVERPVPEPKSCVTWESDVQVLLYLECSTCHSGPRPAAGYDVTYYETAISTATVGDPTSPLLTAHPMQAEPVLRAWVMDCELARRTSLIHDLGISSPTSAAFHGLRPEFDTCAGCHETQSCLGCHPRGESGCASCHADPIDAEHRAHPYDCSTCHEVPERWWDAPRHIDPPPAEVTIDCATIWCHGDASPVWIAGQGEAACGTCHGEPPEDANHPIDECATCHQRDQHVDGVVQIGTTDEGCGGCHGTPDAPAPSDTGHDRHLAPRPIFGAAVPCETCHQVPEVATSPGHLDTGPPVEVLAGWDREGQTCRNACHGAVSPAWTETNVLVCDSCHGIPPLDMNHKPDWPVADCGRCHPVYSEEHIDGNVDIRDR